MVAGIYPLIWGIYKLIYWVIFDLLVDMLGMTGLLHLIWWIIVLAIGGLLILCGLILWLRR
jgi:hypothetical protein